MSENILKIEMNLEDMLLAIKDSIKDELSIEIVSNIKTEIMVDFKKAIDEEMKEAIAINANETVKQMILDIVDNTKYKVGGDWQTEPVEYTLREYATKEIKNIISNNRVNNGKGRKEVSFSEWFVSQCLTAEVESEIHREIKLIKDDINNKITNMFSKQTKELLSETVLQMLMATDTYKNIEGKIKQIADN